MSIEGGPANNEGERNTAAEQVSPAEKQSLTEQSLTPTTLIETAHERLSGGMSEKRAHAALEQVQEHLNGIIDYIRRRLEQLGLKGTERLNSKDLIQRDFGQESMRDASPEKLSVLDDIAANQKAGAELLQEEERVQKYIDFFDLSANEQIEEQKQEILNMQREVEDRLETLGTGDAIRRPVLKPEEVDQIQEKYPGAVYDQARDLLERRKTSGWKFWR